MSNVAIVIPCIPRDLPYLPRAVTSAVRQRGPDNLVVTRVADDPLPVALNALIAGTTAEYIVRLDADDYLSQDAVQVLLAGIGDAPMVYASHYFEEAWDESSSTRIISSGHWVDETNPLGCSCMFRRDAWEAIGGYDESRTHQEATDFLMRMGQVGRVKWLLDPPVYTYVRRPGSLSADIAAVNRARHEMGLPGINESGGDAHRVVGQHQ